MKVILMRDVKDLGRAHEAVSVADGHALNYLIPSKFAIAATPAALKEAEGRKVKAAVRREDDAKALAENLAKLADMKIVITAKANDKGHLYTAVGKSEVVEAVREQAGITLSEDALVVPKGYKEIGEHEVKVSSGEVHGAFTITIEVQ